MKYQLAIFDFDGTLADSMDWFVATLNRVAPRHGFRGVAPDENDTLRGCDSRQLMKHLGLPLWKVPRVVRDFRALQAETIHEIALFPGVAEQMRRLAAAGVRLAIVSSNTQANIRGVLGADGALIGHYGCGASLFGKAAKIRATVRRMGAAPAEAIMIGDEIRDLQAARAAGIASGAVAWGYQRFETLLAHGATEAFASVDAMGDRLLGLE